MLVAVVAAALSLSAPSGEADAAQFDERALVVIERTKTTRVPYTVSMLIRLTLDGRTITDTNSEFHSWPMHRVEATGTNVVANCETGSGTVMNLSTGEVESVPSAGAAACGIAPPGAGLRAVRYLESRESRFGQLDVIELEDGEFLRRYEVTQDGIIVAAWYLPHEDGPRYETLSTVLNRGEPAPALFDERNLDQTFARPVRIDE